MDFEFQTETADNAAPIAPATILAPAEPLTGQGLDTFPDIEAYGQWVIRHRVALVQRVTPSFAHPSGILPMMGIMKKGRRFVRLDVETIAQKLGVGPDHLLDANRRHQLALEIRYQQIERTMQLVFRLRATQYALTLRLPKPDGV